MKRLLWTTVSFLALSVAARGADLAAKKPIPQPPAFTWAGFYAGANLGALHGQSKADELTSYGTQAGYPMTKVHGTGVLGTVNAGYNFQIDKWVYGVEADIGYTNARANGSEFVNSEYNFVHVRYSTLATVRARFGYAFDRVLAYATGGVAFANMRSIGDHQWLQGNTPTNGITHHSGIRTGYAIGAGLEYALTQKISLKTEAMVMGFGKATSNTAEDGCRFSFKKNTASTLKVGVNYHF